MKIKITTPILCSALLTQLVMLPDFLYSQSDFYRGKTITLLHGRAPGGSGDFRVRAVLPFLQKYIPGNPTFVHEYMDGGGGRKAANHIFAMSRTDGLVIGNVGGGVVANAVLGESGVQYDLDKLPFIGSPYSATHYVLATRREAGLTNLEKLRAATGIRLGAQSVGHTNYTIGRIFAALLGLKDTKYVTGYSIPERDVALLRGEIDAITNSDDFYARNPEWIDKENGRFPRCHGDSQRRKAPALFPSARDRNLCQNGARSQVVVDVPSLPAFRIALYSAAGDAERPRRNHQGSDPQKFQGPGIRKRIP